MTLDQILTLLREATEETQGEALREVAAYARDRGWLVGDKYEYAVEWLWVGAYESAALLLVPEGYEWIMGTVTYRRHTPPRRVGFGRVVASKGIIEPHEEADGDALTPACAIAAASLQAHEARERSA